MIRDSVRLFVETALNELNYFGLAYTVEHPPESFGDFSTNVALIIAKEEDKNPREIAENIGKKITSSYNKEVAKVSVDGPGFINITLDTTYITSYIVKKVFKKGWGNNTKLRRKKILFEYSNSNCFKEMHIGHLMSNAIGESLSRLAETAGGKVSRVCYSGDVGLHAAKAIWSLLGQPLKSIDASAVGRAYARGAQAYENDNEARQEIEDINIALYSNRSKKLEEVYNKGKSVSLKNFKEMFSKLGTKFNAYIFESEVAPIGRSVVEKYEDSDVFEKNDGAIIFKGEMFDKKLHTRVFITKRNLPTYETKEIGLAVYKDRTYKPDESYIVTADEIMVYMQVLLCALTRTGFSHIVDYTTHIPHGVLKLTTGKISSRKGGVITARSWIQQMSEEVKKQTAMDLTDEEAERIAIAAVKYAVLKQKNGKDVIFDQKKTLSLQGDSGPYLLYTYVRLRALQKKGGKYPLSFFSKKGMYQHTILIRHLYQFEEVVADAWKTRESVPILIYATKLAGEINSWYAQEKIIGTTEEQEKLVLVRALTRTLLRALYLLGIPKVERM